MRKRLSALAMPLAALVLSGPLPAAAPEPSAEQVRAAVTKSLPLLQKGAMGHTAQRQCFACHSQALPLLAITTAKTHGFAVDEKEVRKQLRFIADFLDGNRDNYRKGQGTGGQADTAGYALLTLEVGGWKPDATTSAMAEYLLLRNKDSDHWPTTSRRPPSEASSFTTTYLALRGLKKFGTPEQQDRITDRMSKARKWLLAKPAKDTEDRVFRLSALKLTGADEKEVRAAVRELVQTQRKDGGWAQLDQGDSDAYATGSALVALQQSGGMAVSDPVYRRGLKFLIGSQREDGSWLVRSRSKPFQTYFETGFPHGKDQFISSAASGWATTALALAAPSEIDDLKSASLEVRLRALQKLVTMPDRASAAAAALIRVLREDSSPGARMLAARALGAARPAPPEALTALAKVLENPGEPVGVRTACVRALAVAGKGEKSAEAVLRRAVEDKDLGGEAFDALCYHSPDVAKEFLHHPDRKVRLRTLRLVSGPLNLTTLAALVDLLREKDVEIRRAVAKIFRNHSLTGGTLTKDQIEVLVAAVRDPDPEVRLGLVPNLVSLNASRSIIPVLAECLKSDDDNLLLRAAQGLSTAGEGVAKVLPDLLAALDRVGPRSRLWLLLIRALGQAGASAGPALPRLLRLSKDEQPFVRFVAAQALATARLANPALVDRRLWELADDRDRAIRDVAREAAGVPGGARRVAEFAAQLEHKDPQLVREAAVALELLGPDAAAASSQLIGALGRVPWTDSFAWGAALVPLEALLRALTEIGRPAVPDLVKGLRADSPHARAGAARVLAEMGPQGGGAVKALRQALKDPNEMVRAWSATALGEIGADAREAVPDLIDLIETRGAPAGQTTRALIRIGVSGKDLERLIRRARDSGTIHRSAVVMALGGGGAEAIPTLRSFLRDPDRGIVLGAQEALAYADRPKLIATKLDALKSGKTHLAVEYGALLLGQELSAGQRKELAVALAEFARRPNPGEQVRLLRLLRRLGPDARGAVPALRALESDPSAAVRNSAKRTLKEIGG